MEKYSFFKYKVENSIEDMVSENEFLKGIGMSEGCIFCNASA